MILLSLHYIRWHYTQGIVDLFNIIVNFLWFFYNLFSIEILLKTLFVPFHRLEEEAKKTFDPSAWVQKIIINTLMRTVGAMMRIFLMCIYLIFLVLTLVLGTFFFVAWIATPLLVPALFGIGVTFIAP